MTLSPIAAQIALATPGKRNIDRYRENRIEYIKAAPAGVDRAVCSMGDCPGRRVLCHRKKPFELLNTQKTRSLVRYGPSDVKLLVSRSEVQEAPQVKSEMLHGGTDEAESCHEE
jgi:hypothetical protein